MPPRVKKPDSIQPILTAHQIDTLSNIFRLHSPAKILLPEGASLEQRALHQCRIQEFESMLGLLIRLSQGLKAEKLESDYKG